MKPDSFYTKYIKDYKWMQMKGDRLWCTICKSQSSSDTLFTSEGTTGGQKGFTKQILTDHVKSKSHKNAVDGLKERKNTTKLMRKTWNDFLSVKDYSNKKILYSTMASYFIAKNDLPFHLMEDVTDLIGTSIKMYTKNATPFEGGAAYNTDKDAKELTVLHANLIREKTIDMVQGAEYFSVMIDESTDISTTKNLSLMVRFLHENDVVVRNLDLVELKGSTSEVIYNCLLATLEKHHLDIRKMVGFGSDGCSVMTGSISGVQTRIRELVSYCITCHCSAHRLALAAKDSAIGYPVESLVHVADLVTAYFNRSATRLSRLETKLSSLDQNFTIPLKSAYTRWLSHGNQAENLHAIFVGVYQVI
jgi:hypothetical protein